MLELVKDKDAEIQDLSERLGESEEWSTAVVAASRYPLLAGVGQSHLGKLLAKKSREMGMEVRKAPFERYPGGIGIYHASVLKSLADEMGWTAHSHPGA